MTTFYKTKPIDSSSKMNPARPLGLNQQAIPTIASARKFIFDLARDTTYHQAAIDGRYFDEGLKATGESIHPADLDFALAARKAVFRKFESAAHTNECVKASMQFRVVSPKGQMRLVNQVLSPITEAGHQVSVVETDLSNFATTPLKVVHLINGEDDPQVSTLKVSGYTTDSALCPFSDRQLQILRLLAEGRTTAEISETLFISSDTVRTHRQHILQRSESSNMTATVVNCVRKGWI